MGGTMRILGVCLCQILLVPAHILLHSPLHAKRQVTEHPFNALPEASSFMAVENARTNWDETEAPGTQCARSRPGAIGSYPTDAPSGGMPGAPSKIESHLPPAVAGSVMPPHWLLLPLPRASLPCQGSRLGSLTNYSRWNPDLRVCF